jgi:hypothetical protein
MVWLGINPGMDVTMPDALLDFSFSQPRRRGSQGSSGFPTESMHKVRAAYQRDGRLAAAASARIDNPSLSLSDALYLVDQALGLRKASAYL